VRTLYGSGLHATIDKDVLSFHQLAVRDLNTICIRRTPTSYFSSCFPWICFTVWSPHHKSYYYGLDQADNNALRYCSVRKFNLLSYLAPCGIPDHSQRHLWLLLQVQDRVYYAAPHLHQYQWTVFRKALSLCRAVTASRKPWYIFEDIFRINVVCWPCGQCSCCRM
jgi:hypothetical protein